MIAATEGDDVSMRLGAIGTLIPEVSGADAPCQSITRSFD